MATKPPPPPPPPSASANSTNSFKRPPQINLADKLLASSITLPSDVVIASATFLPTPGSQNPSDALELARRALISKNANSSLLESFLANVRVGHSSAIYVFRIVTPDRLSEAITALKDLQFEGLDAPKWLTFTPQDVTSASHIPRSYIGPYTTVLGTSDPSASSADRMVLRTNCFQFIEAVRNSLIDGLVKASLGPNISRDREALRFKDGLLLSHPTRPSEWGTEWEHHALRPFIRCTFQILLLPATDVPARLIIHPLLSSTSYLPLAALLPLSPGAPINLLPSGTPAYFLAAYKGPTSGLVSQFNESLVGQGVAGWDRGLVSSRTSNGTSRRHHDKQPLERDSSGSRPGFVIAWLSVENKQGEEKGLTVIWPTSLCLSSHSATMDGSPRMLSYIPELPSELQPSPPPIKATNAMSDSGLGSGLFSPSLPGLPGSPSAAALSPTTEVPQPQSVIDPPQSTSQGSTSFASFPTSDTLRAFRSLTVTRSKNIPQVAVEVGEYVGFVARERERQRDQMRKDRENQSSPGQYRSTSNASSATVANAPIPSSTPSMPSVIAVPLETSSATGLPTIMSPQSSNGLFYPSPPQTNPPVPLAAMPEIPQATGASLELPAANDESTQIKPLGTEPSPLTNPPPFNPFGNIDMSWSEAVDPSNGDFLDMNMDFDMDFSMNINNDSSSTNTGTARGYQRVDMDFDEAFTEDDFSYFDSKPSRPADISSPDTLQNAPTVLIDPLTSSGLAPAGGTAALGLGWSPSLFGDLSFSGPGPPQASSPSKTHWPDGFTPRFGDTEPTPALSPPSPGQSPLSHGGPLTPNVQIEGSSSLHSDPVDAKHGSDLFGPIPFSDTHKFADGKYTAGKFSLTPSPDRVHPPGRRAKPKGWRVKYIEATDPRVGLVRKLIGVKRKSRSQHSVRRPSKTWPSEHEDWDTKYDTEEPESDVESEAGDLEETDSPLVTRPSTPPPLYLPLGHSLLHTQFHHSQLLPLSSSLRPPNLAVAPASIPTGPGAMFAPTPVSPAAALGAANEKSKSLEAAAMMIAREVVENKTWGDLWFATAQLSGHTQQIDTWHADLHYVAHLLSQIPFIETPLDLQQLFAIGSQTALQMAELPSISVSKGDAVIQVLPTAIRFWEKLGLGPKGGPKDVTAYVLLDSDVDESSAHHVELWLRNLSTSYQDKRLGLHIPGRGNGSENGLLRLRFDQQFRKSLGNIVAELPSVEHSLVFYVIAPVTVMTLSSQLCRQILSGVKKASKAYSEAQVLFHFVPETLIPGISDDPAARFTLMEVMCASVYNRLTRPIDRTLSRHFSDHGQRVRAYFQDNAVTLARGKVHAKFSMSGSLDVMDHYTLLQVGYQVSQCGKWILVSCVDERGEMHDKIVWLTRSQGEDSNQCDDVEVGETPPEAYVASKVWGFAEDFAKRANVDWRIIITKLGILTERELQAWIAYLGKANDLQASASHVSLLCAHLDAPWQFIPPPVRSPTKKSRPARATNIPLFADMSANIYVLKPQTIFPLSSPKPISDAAMVEEVPLDDRIDGDELPIFPLATSIIIRAPCEGGLPCSSMLQVHLLYTHCPWDATEGTDEQRRYILEDVSRNFVELAHLAAYRFLPSVNPILPFHLATVNIMNRALAREEEPDDVVGTES